MREGWQDSWDFWSNKGDVPGDAVFLAPLWSKSYRSVDRLDSHYRHAQFIVR
jgi:hypothetical protein